ncbi:MAG: YbhB/YbcL family Raf kinase inhibitor-like protein [Acidimicrobiales bacterium]
MQEGGLRVTSEEFAQGGTIPIACAHSMAGGENLSPQLSWTPGPPGTKSYAITCHDPDAPTGVGFSHWVAFDIDESVHDLDRGLKVPGVSGLTDWGETSYGGMAPPPGDQPHHYNFTVYALDTGALGPDENTTYAKFRFMARNHVLATGTLTGLFAVGGR